jgi:hypothetical protein
MNRKNPSIGRTSAVIQRMKSKSLPDWACPLSRGEFQRAGWLRYSGAAIGSLLACLSVAGFAQEKVNEPNQPDYNAPWSQTKPAAKPAAPAAKKPAAPKPVEPKPAESKPATAPAPATNPTEPAGLMPAPLALPAMPKTTRNEIALSADYVLGQGTITLPLGSAIKNVVPGFPQKVNDADRESTYYGASYAYSLGQAWYLDLAYNQGESDGDFAFDAGTTKLSSSFTIEDTWYQAYLRYTFPQLRGKRFQAYLRAGVSYVQTDLSVIGRNVALTVNQQAETDELYGNLGLGMNYPLYRAGRFQIRVNADAEAFFGQRSTDLTESFNLTSPFVLSAASNDSFDSTVYGGYARATIRAQYELTESGLLRAFLDVGAQVKYTQIDYPQGWFDEVLWGPYVKAGLLYSF